MICNTIGLTTDSFETLYVHGGAEVPEVYGSINYAQPIFYSLKTLTGTASYSFMGYPEPLKSYEIDGNMAQSGTPTPTLPIYPQECGDRTENLFDKDVYLVGGTPNPQLSQTNFRHIIKVKPNTQYTMSSNVPFSKSANHLYFYTNGYNQSAFVTIYNGSPQTVTSDNDGNLYFEYAKRSYYNNLLSGKYYIMLNEGPTALPYEPYGYKLPLNLNGTTQNLYLTEPLRKIGNYADEVNSDGTVTRRIKKLVLTGEEDWTIVSGRLCVSKPADCRQYSASASTHFIQTQSAANPGEMYVGGSYINFNYDGANDNIPAFKSYLAAQYAAGTPVTVWYVLATPTTETITSPAVIPITGSNTLAIDTTLQPSSLSITGHVKPSS